LRFKLLEWETYVYTPPPAAGHADLIDTLSGRSIKGTLRRARRDLEIVDISVRDYLHIQQSTLQPVERRATALTIWISGS